jgi:DNA-binding winged helix-turn-helix (wHTH) protein/tetratricopeptide (TPR) repeat protein
MSKNEGAGGSSPKIPRGTMGGPHESSGRGAPISFGPFRLDSRGGRLLRGNESVPLRPKTWSVLHYLADRPGELVTKHELLDAVWPEVTVTEEVVRKSINELRAALGDSSEAPHLIETVPRRGFRFIAEIQIPGPKSLVSGSPSLVPGLGEDQPETRDQKPGTRFFVGRDQELQQLASLFGRASGGERQCVFITGEVGIGKTALAATFVDSLAIGAARAPVCTARGACVEQLGAREAYLPVLTALERLAHRPNCDRLTELLRRVAPTWLAQMPWLIGDDEAQALRQVLQVVRPERMLREFAALVEALTTDVTLVLVLEDLHWSDASTVDLLWLLAQRREPARLLLIGTFRPADAIVREHGLMNVVRTLAVRRQCVHLPLSQLREEDVRHYLGERFPGNDFPPALATVIHRHTDGNPLFMIGIVDHLLSRGDILDTAPGWALRVPLETITLGVPDDVRLLIENFLDALSPGDRRVLQAASVAGEHCTAIVVAAALGGDVAEVETRCEALVQASRFLRIAGQLEWPDGRVVQRYAFVHELYREAVYEQMTPGQRMQLHQRIGQALEAASDARRLELAPELAMHFERGHDQARALRYLTIAAGRARLRFANREAEAYLQSALGLLARRPEDETRRREELELRLALGAVVADLHGFASEQVRENCERAAELCGAVGSAAQRFGVLYARWYLHAMRGDRPATAEVAAELDGVARRLASAPHRAVAASVLVRTATYDGRFAEATRIMERRLAHAPVPKGIAVPAFGPDPVLAATMHSAVAHWFLGHPERARVSARAAVARARTLGHFFTLCAVLTQAACVELLCRNVGTGGDLAGESASLATEHGFPFWNAMASMLTGWASVQQGRASEGSAAIAAAIPSLEAAGGRFFLDFAYAFLAEGHLRADKFAEGLAAVDAGLGMAAANISRGYAPELWRLKGELLQRQLKVESSKPALSAVEGLKARNSKNGGKKPDNAAQAEACFQRALRLARASEAKSLELRAATSLARLWRTRGRAAEARKLLGGVCRRFGARPAGPDLIEARALLGQLEAENPKFEARSKSKTPTPSDQKGTRLV